MFEIVEFGHYGLVLALGLCVSQIGLGIWGVVNKDLRSIAITNRMMKAIFYLVSLSFVALIIAFLNNDFSVRYIALHSNVNLDWYYKISASWAGHEGSLLLWLWSLCLWSFLVAKKTTDLPPMFRSKVLIILGVIIVGFLSFIILTSNPFLRVLPTNNMTVPLIGKDLNPMLQDVGLILHPPLLYMGYVGFAICFVFIVASLIDGRLDTRLIKWTRNWTMAAWSFLTLGIAFGSWWAYYELGWGGWWFWDPVENSSFMPWLAGTALIHSLIATEKRDVFKIWTSFLAITTFSLSLVGTFLVRSGVLTSVHAFASDPARGIYILMLLALISGSAFLLLIFRSHTLHSTGEFSWLSREMMILFANLILIMACLIVFVGTLTPLLYDVLGLERISIGAPYFNGKMLWVLLVALVFFTFAPFIRYKKDRIYRLLPRLALSLLLGVISSYFIIVHFDFFDVTAFLLLSLTIMSIVMLSIDFLKIIVKQKRMPAFGYMAMFTGHLGFLCCVIGIVLAGTYSLEKDIYVKIGDTVHLYNHSFEATKISSSSNNQYDSVKIDFLVRDKNGEIITVLQPEKRRYHITRMPISESAILPHLTKDIYIALGEEQDTDAWSVRIQIKPFIRWVWLGGIIMALASLFVLYDRRYKRASKERNK